MCAGVYRGHGLNINVLTCAVRWYAAALFAPLLRPSLRLADVMTTRLSGRWPASQRPGRGGEGATKPAAAAARHGGVDAHSHSLSHTHTHTPSLPHSLTHPPTHPPTHTHKLCPPRPPAPSRPHAHHKYTASYCRAVFFLVIGPRIYARPLPPIVLAQSGIDARRMQRLMFCVYEPWPQSHMAQQRSIQHQWPCSRLRPVSIVSIVCQHHHLLTLFLHCFARRCPEPLRNRYRIKEASGPTT